MIVTGGRGYADAKAMADRLSALHETRGVACVIHGAARGADSLAHAWALGAGVQPIPVPPDYVPDDGTPETTRHNKRAPVLRSQRMLDAYRPDLGIAFPGGRGTSDMVRRLHAAHVPVIDGLTGELIPAPVQVGR